jgi:phosphopantothenoylcysteine synthetase/decarboxylase
MYAIRRESLRSIGFHQLVQNRSQQYGFRIPVCSAENRKYHSLEPAQRSLIFGRRTNASEKHNDDGDGDGDDDDDDDSDDDGGDDDDDAGMMMMAMAVKMMMMVVVYIV